MDKFDQAILRFKTASEISLQVYEKPLIITDSGGKDSSALVDLAIKAKIPIEIQHSHTTADAPETVRFVRKKFYKLECDGHNVQINQPRYKGEPTSMWKLIPPKLFPPTRLVRYCCEVLKEQSGANRMIATGIRWAESAKRKNGRGIYETLSNKKQNQIILSNDNDDRRQLFENCQLKAKRTVNPIIDWSDKEVWDYINVEQVQVNPLYGCGFARVGCVGCPLSSQKNRKREFNYFPKFKQMYIETFDRMIAERKRRDTKGNATWANGNEVFLWWTDDKNLDGQLDWFSGLNTDTTEYKQHLLGSTSSALGS